MMEEPLLNASTLRKKELLRRAYQIGLMESHDNSTRIGALLVDRDGEIVLGAANKFAPGVQVTDARLERNCKNDYMIHAEENAIFAAAERGIKTRGLVLVCPWFPCPRCACAVIRAGIAGILVHRFVAHKTIPERWHAPLLIGQGLLDEAGVVTELYHDDIEGAEMLCDGELIICG